MRFVASLQGDLGDIPDGEWYIEGHNGDHDTVMEFVAWFAGRARPDADYIIYRVVDGAWYKAGMWIANQKTLDTSDAF